MNSIDTKMTDDNHILSDIQPKAVQTREFIQRNFPGAVLKLVFLFSFSLRIASIFALPLCFREEYLGLLTYYVPPTNNLKWSAMFGLMEVAKRSFDIEDYSISQTSLEQVFLSFTKFQRDDKLSRRGS